MITFAALSAQRRLGALKRPLELNGFSRIKRCLQGIANRLESSRAPAKSYRALRGESNGFSELSDGFVIIAASQKSISASDVIGCRTRTDAKQLAKVCKQPPAKTGNAPSAEQHRFHLRAPSVTS